MQFCVFDERPNFLLFDDVSLIRMGNTVYNVQSVSDVSSLTAA